MAAFRKTLKGLNQLRSVRERFPVSDGCPLPDRHTLGRLARQSSEGELFRVAIADAHPLADRDRHHRPSCRQARIEPETARPHLAELVRTGNGFVVSQTPEYMEGRALDVPPDMVTRLHAGDFAIQDHIDLHGCSTAEARLLLDGFLAEAVRRGLRVVCVIHGRGLSSPHRPVLKENLPGWLTGGPWKRWVMAYASARAGDGGAGATYVMLRRRPRRGRMAQDRS